MSVKISGNQISLTRGDTLKVTIGMTFSDGTEYVPTEGDVIRFALKKSITDDTPLIVRDIPTDTRLLHLLPSDTKDLPFGKYKYDIELRYFNGDVDTFIGPESFFITEEVH